MKKIAAFLLIVSMVSVGCATKLEVAKDDITQTWHISKVFQDGQDITSSYLSSREDYSLSFDNQGGFIESYYPFSGSPLVTINGTWEFTDGIRKVTLSGPSQTRIYQIDLLDESHFNVTDISTSNGVEIQFIPG